MFVIVPSRLCVDLLFFSLSPHSFPSVGSSLTSSQPQAVILLSETPPPHSFPTASPSPSPLIRHPGQGVLKHDKCFSSAPARRVSEANLLLSRKQMYHNSGFFYLSFYGCHKASGGGVREATDEGRQMRDLWALYQLGLCLKR